MLKNQSINTALRSVFIVFCLLNFQAALAQDHDEHGHESDFIKLTAAELNEFNIEVATAASGTVAILRKLPGEVRVNEDRLAHIGPRYAGVVSDVKVKVGDVVKAGQKLAVVESDESLAPYFITTAQSGTIVERHLTVGEPVSRESGGFVVADLSDVWVDITVYQHDLDNIRTGEKVVVNSGSGKHSVTGLIEYVSPVVDEHTRTATARLVVENHDGLWRPGMFISAIITVTEVSADVVVPLSAVLNFEGHDVVFVQEHDGFKPQRVEVGQQGNGKIIILSGLKQGASFVASGGFTLKAELGKESFGDGHNH